MSASPLPLIQQWNSIVSLGKRVKKSPVEPSSPGFTISTDAAARAAHLEHSIRFLQEQHRLMLAGLHAEVEALRERNRDLQFQLIFNKESSPKVSEVKSDNAEEESNKRLKAEVSRLEREAAAARGEARAAEARALQMQRTVDEQAEKIRELELQKPTPSPEVEPDDGSESRAELRARLADAARLVRRLRGDADRQRREVPRGSGVTNLLFDDAAVKAAHLHCMKSSLQASLRATGLEPGFGFHNSYHFPPVHTPDFWREPLREDYNMMGSRGRNNRRPLTLPELAPHAPPPHHAHNAHRATIYANNYTRPRPNGFENKPKRVSPGNVENVNVKMPGDSPELHISGNYKDKLLDYPEVKVVVTKLDRIPLDDVSVAGGGEARRGGQRRQHRKHATEHT